MSSGILIRLLNLSMRAISMACKFALILALAKYLDPANLGAYGLMAATVSFVVLAIGGDYYLYAQRFLFENNGRDSSFVIFNHVVALVFLYVFILPFTLLLPIFGIMDWEWMGVFYLLLIGEHLSIEIYRLLVALNHQISASVLQFMRTGMWSVVVVLLFYVDSDSRSLNSVYLYWVIGSFLSIAFGVYVVYEVVDNWRRAYFDFKWVKAGFSIGVVLLVSTLCFRSLQTIDKYTFEYLVGSEMLGAYVFFISITLALINLMEPAVFSFSYPKIMRLYSLSRPDYKIEFSRFLIASTLLSLLFCVATYLLMPYVFLWIDNKVYYENVDLLWMLLPAPVFYSIGMVYHYGLYAAKRDREIFISHISALPVFAIILTIASIWHPREATPLAVVGSFFYLMVAKYVFYRSKVI